ncbi:MAG: endopeptidase La [Ruminococcaceae bacterium]|nr:endopeptidase La [Oscillospiraceae bacterium]
MPRYIEKLEMMNLPCILARDTLAFPFISLGLEITGDEDIDLCEKASDDQSYIFLVAQKDPNLEEPSQDDVYEVGTVCRIKQFLRLPEGNARMVVEGVYRANLLSLIKQDGAYRAEVMCKAISINADTMKVQALIREVLVQFDEFKKYMPKLSAEIISTVQTLKDPGALCDYIAFNILVNFADKQAVLSVFDPAKRLEKLAVIMAKELKILSTELNIHNKVRQQIDDNQREFYLRAQLKVIQNELGEGGADSEIDEYDEMIYNAHLPEEIEAKLLKELRKLSKTPYASSEAAVIRTYIDTCLEIPWSKITEDRLDIEKAREILEADHDGLTKIKERILEFLAVKQLNPGLNNQILCLVGPPGTGKTSICESIARAMQRKYVRVCLGGVRDEADIRGHRRTYIASMPGRIVNGLIQAQSRNPLMLLDEIDKLTSDAHGDPSSALLEVLDSEQNHKFRDHFVEMPIDLSDTLFIATANDLNGIPRPLMDRMEIIELDIYNRHQKLAIAKNHLIRKQREKHGLNGRTLKISDEAIFDIIDFYTSEAGVRNLNRELATICRKAAKRIVSGECKSCNVTAKNLKDYLGNRKILPKEIDKDDAVGEVNGLAYTSLGGDILKIEVASMKGSGKLELTGSLGDVMQESARAALTCIRTRVSDLGIAEDFYKELDIHIHVPEGAVPKDGPSAGVTMTVALASELTGKAVRRDVAMTGEITLRGKVLAIGGLKEKSMAAYKAGVKTILIPKDNVRDIEEIDEIIKANVTFVPIETIDDALAAALV